MFQKSEWVWGPCSGTDPAKSVAIKSAAQFLSPEITTVKLKLFLLFSFIISPSLVVNKVALTVVAPGLVPDNNVNRRAVCFKDLEGSFEVPSG